MADYGIRCYRLRGALLARALLEGFAAEEDGTLRVVGDGPHRIFLPALDSVRPDNPWGRLSLRCHLGPESMLTVRAFADDRPQVLRDGRAVQIDELLLDAQIPLRDKERLFTLAGGMERSGVRDVLLDGQRGDRKSVV